MVIDSLEDRKQEYFNTKGGSGGGELQPRKAETGPGEQLACIVRKRAFWSPRNFWIHVGSQQAGPEVAAILSIVESCRRLKIPVRDYLAAILPGLSDSRVQSVKERTPSAWAAANL
jgi:hypothetical protein